MEQTKVYFRLNLISNSSRVEKNQWALEGGRRKNWQTIAIGGWLGAQLAGQFPPIATDRHLDARAVYNWIITFDLLEPVDPNLCVRVASQVRF